MMVLGVQIKALKGISEAVPFERGVKEQGGRVRTLAIAEPLP